MTKATWLSTAIAIPLGDPSLSSLIPGSILVMIYRETPALSASICRCRADRVGRETQTSCRESTVGRDRSASAFAGCREYEASEPSVGAHGEAFASPG